MLFLGFSVQRLGLFKEKECWTLLLTAEKAEFFHWISEEKYFVIPRSQASQTMYVPNRPQSNHFMLVKRPSGYLYFFKMTETNAEMLRDWMGVAPAKQGPAAFISNLCQLLYRPVFHLS